MTLPDRDHLDTAIDQVTARMVAVPDDREVTLRILAALPDRPSRARWLLPQCAAIGAMAIAALVWTTRTGPVPLIATRPSAAVAAMSGLANGVASNEPRTVVGTATVVRTMPLESASARNSARELRRDHAVAAFGREGGPQQPLAPLEWFPERDHDRALPAIEALNALTVDEVSPTSIAASPLLSLAPIEVVELPMTADFPPQ